MRILPSWTNHFPKTPPLNTITLKIHWTFKFGENTSILSVTESLLKSKYKEYYISPVSLSIWPPISSTWFLAPKWQHSHDPGSCCATYWCSMLTLYQRPDSIKVVLFWVLCSFFPPDHLFLRPRGYTQVDPSLPFLDYFYVPETLKFPNPITWLCFQGLNRPLPLSVDLISDMCIPRTSEPKGGCLWRRSLDLWADQWATVYTCIPVSQSPHCVGQNWWEWEKKGDSIKPPCALFWQALQMLWTSL